MTTMPTQGAGDDELLPLVTVLEASPTPTIAIDEHHVIVAASTSACALLDRPRLIGLSIHDLVPPEIRDRHKSWVTDFVANPTQRAMGGLVARVIRVKTAIGADLALNIAIGPPLPGHKGAIAQLTNITDVISDREATLSAQRLQSEAEAKLRAATVENESLHRRESQNRQFGIVRWVIVAVTVVLGAFGLIAAVALFRGGNAEAAKEAQGSFREIAVIGLQVYASIIGYALGRAAAAVAGIGTDRPKESTQ
ncbi:MAG: PAS domain-containing protein [Cetobacterium sp.]